MSKDMIEAKVDAGGHTDLGLNRRVKIVGDAIRIKTPAGLFVIGTTKNGHTYLSCRSKKPQLIIQPQAGNRILLLNAT